MSEAPAKIRRLQPDTMVLTLASIALVAAAAMVMFSTFMFYDDEGYVLLSLRNFAEHGGLYRDVYTQYGPFPFVSYYALQAFGLPLNHTVGRLITIGAWAGTAWACVALVGQVTRHLALRLGVLVGVFVYLWVMASEPSHPGGLIVFFTALLAWLGYRWIERGAWTQWAILVGVVVAALLLTKINVGIFAAFSAVAWWLLHHRARVLRRWAPVVVGIAGVALPFGLMRPLLGTPWVRDFAIVFSCSAIALAAATSRGATGRVNWRTLGIGLTAALVTAAVVLTVVILRGTAPSDLLEGMLLGPIKHPVSFSLPFVWPPGIAVIAMASAGLCGGAWLLRRRGHESGDVIVAWLRLIAAVALAVNLARYPAVRPDYLAFGCALPCLWLFAWPLAGAAPEKTSARAWLALLLLGQSLHVFPVPGSQIAWGTVLVIPLAAVGAWEAATWLARRAPGTWLAAPRTAFAVSVALVMFSGGTGWSFAQIAARYPGGQSIGLPGAEAIRLPDNSAALFRVLAHNAVAHADVLFSLPGTYSFNLWTGVPTPTHANVTHWFSLLDDTRQQAIIRELEAHPRACVIAQPGHVKFLADRNLAPKGILFDYITQNFEPAFAFDDVEFRVRRGRKIAPFLVAELLTLAPAAAAKPGAESTLLRFSLLTPPRAAIASLEISTLGPKGAALLNAANARLEVAPANARGEPTGPARAAAWPLAISGPAILSVYFERERFEPMRGGATIVGRDASGQEVALARVAP